MHDIQLPQPGMGSELVDATDAVLQSDQFVQQRLKRYCGQPHFEFCTACKD